MNCNSYHQFLFRKNKFMKKIKLFCIPYATGSAKSYLKWKRHLNENITLIPLELSGRGIKKDSQFHTDMRAVVLELFAEFKSQISDDDIYFVYGHSFGGLIAYEINKLIVENNLNIPSGIFFSGIASPFTHKSTFKADELTQAKLLELFECFGGNISSINKYENIFTNYLELLKADFSVIANYFPIHDNFLINSDVYILSGIEDKTINDSGLISWKNNCASNFKIHKIFGAHLFPFTNSTETCIFLNQILAQY